MHEDNDIQIGDVENYSGEKDQQFSHKELVMRVMRICIELGSREMKPGWFNEKLDKRGNIVKVYIDDTRKGFIEAVKTAMMVMNCDFDPQTKRIIKKRLEDHKKVYKKFCNLETKDWASLNLNGKQFRWGSGIFYRKDYLSSKLPYAEEFLEYEVECYRKIFAELTNLTSRLDFYQAEDFEA